MLTTSEVSALIPDTLAGDLVSRTATAADRDAVVDLQGVAHVGPDGRASDSIKLWQRDLFDRPHPTVTLDDMMVVADRRTGDIVASLMIVPQVWSYARVSFGVGRPELAATRPDYRGRGLMAHLMWSLAKRSEARGELVQAASDFLHLTDQMGYHMALPQRSGRGGRVADLPPAPADVEPVRLRPATMADVDVLARADERMRERVLLSCLRDEAQWRHEVAGRSPGNMVRDEVLIIEAPHGPVGYLAIGYGGIPTFPVPSWLPGQPCPEPVVSITSFELVSDVSWFDTAPSVLRQLATTTTDQERAPTSGFMLWLGSVHPAYAVVSDRLTRDSEQVGWFLRVPDLCAFLRRISPVLERRLVGSPAESFTGDLKVDVYQEGLRLRFAAGRILGIEPWDTPGRRRASDASLPRPMLLQLIFGQGDWDSLAPAYPDCRMQNGMGRLLLPRLFPRQPSAIWPLT